MPPVYKVPAPFGSYIGGTNPLFWKMKPETEWDSWMSVGPVNQTSLAKSLSSIGIEWANWCAHLPGGCRQYSCCCGGGCCRKYPG